MYVDAALVASVVVGISLKMGDGILEIEVGELELNSKFDSVSTILMQSIKSPSPPQFSYDR